MDDENQMALNEPVEADNDGAVTPTVEQEAGEDVTESDDISSEDNRSEVTETERVDKKGYSTRVRELNARAKKAEAEAESLAEKLAALTGSRGNTEYDGFDPSPILDEPIVKPGEEIDAVELDNRLRARERRILQQADAMSTLRSKQNDAINRINSEAIKVMQKYPELDPDSSSFNEELSIAISEATEAHVKGAPYTASVTSFVDKMMRPYKGAVSREVGDMTKSVAKQVSEAALRPTSVREKERSVSEKSIAELEAQLGVVQA